MKTVCSQNKLQGENTFHALSQLHATEFTSFVVHNTPVSSTALSNLLDLHIFILKYQVSLCIYYFWIVHMCINYTWSYIWCILIILLSIKLSYSFLFSLNSFLFLISLFFTFVSPFFLFSASVNLIRVSYRSMDAYQSLHYWRKYFSSIKQLLTCYKFSGSRGTLWILSHRWWNINGSNGSMQVLCRQSQLLREEESCLAHKTVFQSMHPLFQFYAHSSLLQISRSHGRSEYSTGNYSQHLDQPAVSVVPATHSAKKVSWQVLTIALLCGTNINI